MTRFEKERTGLVHQETIKDLRHLQLEQEKLHKKVTQVIVFPHTGSHVLLTVQVELLTQELHATESEKGMQVKRLETQLEDARQQLLGYEKIEKELDDIIMESAHSKLIIVFLKL